MLARAVVTAARAFVKAGEKNNSEQMDVALDWLIDVTLAQEKAERRGKDRKRLIPHWRNK